MEEKEPRNIKVDIANAANRLLAAKARAIGGAEHIQAIENLGRLVARRGGQSALQEIQNGPKTT